MRKSTDGLLILLSAAIAVVVLAAGCGGDLPTASRLERTRVLGARVQVAADPGRADALPGEAAAVEWLVAGPRGPAALSLSWAFALCTGVDGACVDAATMPVAGTGAPVIAPFTAPAVLEASHRPLMVGAVCAGGAPTLDANGAPACDATSESTNVARFTIPMPSLGEAANRHPNLGNDALELDGRPWTAEPAGDAGGPCDATTGPPVVPAGAPQLRIRLVSDGDDREPVAGAADTREELQLSSFATDGELEGSYALIAAADPRPDADFVAKWTPPAAAEVAAVGATVHFHFVVRDGRGGLDWVHRALCVVAP